MRVAFLNRSRESAFGGDFIETDALKPELQKLGIEWVEEDGYTLHERESRYALIHIHHINFTWSRINFGAVARCHLPTVITPEFYPAEIGLSFLEMRRWLRLMDYVLPYSRREGDEIVRLLGRPYRMRPIPTGTSPDFHAPNERNRKGVLCVTARLPDKNTWEMEEYCRQAGLDYTCAQGIPYAEMPAVYARHRLFLNGSNGERMSLTTGEALCAGCRVLDSEDNWGNEWYPRIQKISHDAPYFVEALKAAYYAQEWDFTPNETARGMTWAKMAQAYAAVYEEVLS